MYRRVKTLLLISLTALVMLATTEKLGLDPDIAIPSFKNALNVVKRHLFGVIRGRTTPEKARNLARQRTLNCQH